MGHPTVYDTSKVSSTQPSEAPQLPQYAVDFHVKIKTGFLGKTVKFERRQFVLTGQTLEVRHQGKTTHSFAARDITIELLSGHVYRLKAKVWQRLELSIPSASRLDRFRHVLSLAAMTPRWTPPTYDIMTNLLHVATEIIEMEAAAPPSDVAHSTVTVFQVQAHLAEMFAMYEFQGKCTTMLEVYNHLLDLEAEYCADVSVDNFAHTVHRLHPVKYKSSIGRAKSERTPLKEIYSKCPYPDCGNNIPTELMYKFHVKGEAVECGKCGNMITLSAYRMAALIADAPEFVVESILNGERSTIRVVTPPMPSDGNVKTFMDELRTRMREQAPNGSRDAIKTLQNKVSDKAWPHLNAQAFGTFELDLVLAMIRQLDFVNKICAHMEYWNNPTVIKASIIRYEKFLHLRKAKSYTWACVPTSDIDLVWHTHQADSKQYVMFCTANYRQVIDHDDTIGKDTLDFGYAHTWHHWAKTYDDFYSSQLPTQSVEGITAYDVPSRDYRFFGVDEPFPVAALSYAKAVVPDELAVDATKKPLLHNLDIYLTVIGTPVMDGRVRLQYSRQSYVMGQGRLGYVYFDATAPGKAESGGCVCAGYAHAGCGSSGCGSGGCGSGGCGDGGGGCGGGCGGCGGCA
ncbi:hypothetical protein LEN26_020101 [Aphanomyces euteiches]|nr:hypothetical protein LEN26_020101 [Aphanomyces euteiches]KAH9115359.1 hypothetical protein AeMF1_010625 [Aphanomyces euteiches]